MDRTRELRTVPKWAALYCFGVWKSLRWRFLLCLMSVKKHFGPHGMKFYIRAHLRIKKFWVAHLVRPLGANVALLDNLLQPSLPKYSDPSSSEPSEVDSQESEDIPHFIMSPYFENVAPAVRRHEDYYHWEKHEIIRHILELERDSRHTRDNHKRLTAHLKESYAQLVIQDTEIRKLRSKVKTLKEAQHQMSTIHLTFRRWLADRKRALDFLAQMVPPEYRPTGNVMFPSTSSSSSPPFTSTTTANSPAPII